MWELNQITLDGDRVVVAVRGEIDLRTAPSLGDELERSFDAGYTTIIVDLSAATFLDSSGLNILFNTRRRLARLGGQLGLVVTDPSLLRTLDLTGLKRLAPVASTVDQALAELGDRDTRPASA